MNEITMNGYTRVTKAQAEKLFNLGFDVMFTPCRCRPANMQGFWSEFNKADKDRYNVAPGSNLFAAIVNDYTTFVCTSNEIGKYPAFYIRDRLLLDLKPSQDGNGTTYGVSGAKETLDFIRIWSRHNRLAISQHNNLVTVICS